MKSILVLFAAILSLSIANAQSTVNPVAPSGNHPCKKIKDACTAAGYVKGGHKQTPPKGLYKDCMQPILSGSTVSGVSVAAADVQACQAMKAKKGTH